MKNILFVLFLTVTFAFGRGPSTSADTKVLSVVTNGTEVITITETTSKSIDFYAFGMRNSATNTMTVTTNVIVSTLPSPERHEINVDEWVKERELAFKAQLKAEKERKERKEQEKKRAEAYRNAYEFLSKPISKEK